MPSAPPRLYRKASRRVRQTPVGEMDLGMAVSFKTSMIESKLGRVQQDPKHVGKAFGFSFRFGLADEAQHPRQFLFGWPPAQAGEVKAFDAFGQGQSRRFGDSCEHISTCHASRVGNESSIH